MTLASEALNGKRADSALAAVRQQRGLRMAHTMTRVLLGEGLRNAETLAYLTRLTIERLANEPEYFEQLEKAEARLREIGVNSETR